MEPKRFTATYFSFFVIFFLFAGSGLLFAVQDAAKAATDSGLSGGDVFEFLLVAGYIVGVFVLLPWVIYTNTKEKLSVMDAGSAAGIQPDASLTEEERNKQALMILEEIEQKLTPYQEDEQDMITITKGSQARFMKKGIDYIQQNLVPTDPDIIERVNEFIAIYENRTKRVFTGSKWIIISAVGLAALFVWTGGITSFLFIHILGIVFYILSSRTPMYLLEKRLNMFGGGGSFIGSIFGGLFIGAGAKHYNVYADGRKERDYSSEFTGGAAYFLIIVVAALFLGFMAAALGVVNFLMNYMNNALIPSSPKSWYEKTFATN